MNSAVKRHLIIWLAYWIFEAYIGYVWMLVEVPDWNKWDVAWRSALAEGLQIALVKAPLVYSIFHLLVAPYCQRWGNFWSTMLCIGVFLAYWLLDRLLLTYYVYPVLLNEKREIGLFAFAYALNTFMDLLFVMGVAVGMQQYSINRQNQEKEKMLIKEKLETELNFLKAQTNPHFLFNTLNNIYYLARSKAESTPEVVMQLSKLLRFMLYESQQYDISLSREVKMLEDYLDIERIRYDERLDIRFENEVDDEDTRIAPLLLVPLVENAFKHGAGQSTGAAYIHIDLQVKKQQLKFLVENSLEERPVQEPGEGIGIKNLRRRLELMYPRFELKHEIEGLKYRATLQIQLDQHHAY
jgi:two-component system, LytTR family, sensor kinase